MLEFGLVGGCHQHETRQATEVGRIEGAGVRRPVGTDQAGAIEREAHGQALDGDVVHHLIVGALQEGRVDGRERLEAFGRQARGKGDAVLLGDAHVEGAVGKFLAEQVEPRSRRHGRRDRHDLVVLARLLDQAVGEHACV